MDPISTSPSTYNVPFYQEAKIMRIVGAAFLPLATVGAVAAISAAIVINPLFALGVVGVVLAIGLGLFLIKKDYWNDPAFVKTSTDDARLLSFQGIIDVYGWNKTFNTLQFKEGELTEKFLDHVRSSKMSPSAVAYNYTRLNDKYGFCSGEDLKTFFNERLQREPLKSVIKTGEDWKTILDNGWVEKSFLIQKMLHEGYTLFDLKQHDWAPLKLNVVDPSFFTFGANNLLQTKSLIEMLETFGLDIISNQVLPIDDYFRNRFVEMIRSQPLKKLIPFLPLFNPALGLLPLPLANIAKEYCIGIEFMKHLEERALWDYDKVAEKYENALYNPSVFGKIDRYERKLDKLNKKCELSAANYEEYLAGIEVIWRHKLHEYRF